MFSLHPLVISPDCFCVCIPGPDVTWNNLNTHTEKGVSDVIQDNMLFVCLYRVGFYVSSVCLVSFTPNRSSLFLMFGLVPPFRFFFFFFLKCCSHIFNTASLMLNYFNHHSLTRNSEQQSSQIKLYIMSPAVVATVKVELAGLLQAWTVNPYTRTNPFWEERGCTAQRTT